MTTLVFVAGYAAFFLLVVFLLLFLKRRSRQERSPFPENTRLLRGPGESLRRKILELDTKITDSLAFGIPVPLLAFSGLIFITSHSEGWMKLALAGASLATLGAFFVVWAKQTSALIERRRNTNLGWFGERIVAEHLESLKPLGFKIFHDVPAGDPPGGSTTPAFNLDHVVVGPAGVFALETKTRRKGRARVGFMAHEIIYDGRALSYPWGEDRHGLDQALLQAEWLATHLARQLGRPVPVRPLLVFPGWMIIRKAAGAVTVLNPRELPATIQPSGSQTPTLDPLTIELIARELEASCRDVEL